MSIHPITGKEVQDLDNEPVEHQPIDHDTARFFRSIGFVLLLAASAGLMLWLCAWSARKLWATFQGL